jgi:hypothetical protein
MTSDSDAPLPSPDLGPNPGPASGPNDWSSTPAAQRPGPDWFKRFILDYNPFFLLSALCMLLGSLLLTNSLSWSPVRLERVLLLTATVNVYELILVGLGLFLVVRRNARRDAGILLVLEAFFLVDVAFLNAELFAIDRWVGLIANVGLLTLAVVKLAVIFHVLRVPLTSPIAACLVGEIVALYALPGVLKFYAAAGDGTLPALAMLTVWWGIALLGAAIYYASRHVHVHVPLLGWFAPFTAIVAGVSLLAHAGTQQWVYDLGYYGAHLAPMLALAAFVLCHRTTTVPVGLGLALGALMAAGRYPSSLAFELFDHRITPVHVTLVMVYVAMAWTLARAIFAWAMTMGVGVAAVALFGPAPSSVAAGLRIWAEWVWGGMVGVFQMLRPRTQTHWGVVSVAMSFVFLAIGAVISLLRKERPTPTPET